MRNPFRYFNSSPEVIRLTVMMYIRYPLSLRRCHVIEPQSCKLAGKLRSRRGRHGLPYAHRFVAKQT